VDVGHKATKVQMLERIEKVKELLLTWNTRYLIVQYCAKVYGVRPRIVDRYIARATREIEEEYEPDRLKELKKHIARRERLARKALAKGQLKVALDIEDSIAKLKGLFVDQMKHSGFVGVFDPTQCSKEQLERIRAGEDPGIVLQQNSDK